MIAVAETDAEYGARRRAEADSWKVEWEAFSARIAVAGAPENVMIGDPTRRKPFYSIDLIQLDNGWHVRHDYGYPNGGGGGPFGRHGFATREDALVSDLRYLLNSCAKDVAVGRAGSEAFPTAWAQWAIALVPLDLFGGVDLASEFEAMKAMYRRRNELRCAAIRAAEHVPGTTYIDEEGRERSVYSL